MPWTTVILLAVIFLVILLVGYLIHFRMPSPKKQELVRTVTIVGVIITASSLLFAAYTYYDSAKRQKELLANSIYQEHLKMSVDHPSFLGSSKIAQTWPPPAQLSDDQKVEYERYQWYVGHTLFIFENILEAFPNDREWKKTFAGFINDHKLYLETGAFKCERYTQGVKVLVNEVLNKQVCSTQ